MSIKRLTIQPCSRRVFCYCISASVPTAVACARSAQTMKLGQSVTRRLYSVALFCEVLTMRLFSVPWLRTLFVYVVLFTIFLFYGQTSFYHDPGSIFFDETRAFERLYSTHREHEVRQFINEVRSNLSGPTIHAKSEPRICASFLSVKREGDQYLPVFVLPRRRLCQC